MKKAKITPSKTEIKKQTDNQRIRKEEYREARDKFMALHKFCEACGHRKATSLHHRSHRKGFNLTRFFMATCRKCHNEIHDFPEESRFRGYIIDVSPTKREVPEGDYPIKEPYLKMGESPFEQRFSGIDETGEQAAEDYTGS